MGTWGPGLFDNDVALDLLDTLAEQDVGQRRQTLERILRRQPGHLDDVAWLEGPGAIVAAAAVVAAGLSPGGAIAREISNRGYDTAAIVIPGDPVLANDALMALLIAAGHDPLSPYDGAWHYGWTNAETALQARRATDELAAVFYQYQHRDDQELPLEW